MNFDNTYTIIDLDIIRRNFETIAKKASVPVMAIIKADAYGHGAIAVAKELEDLSAFFGVSSILEAQELRNAGFTKPILILGQTPPAAFTIAIDQGIRPTIYRYEDALTLSEAAVKLGKTAPFHFAVDTGMSRIGFQVCEEDADVCAKIAQLPGLCPEGLFSHFATADCKDLTRTKHQAELFDAFDDMLRQRGVQVQIRHLNNSAGIMNFETQYDMVRSGIITYGMYPSDEVDPALLDIEPALSWYCPISLLKTLPAGREISYGGTYVTTKDTVVATLPVGYADGYRRSLSNKFYVLIRGKKAPILGRICMDQMMVDVTDIPGVTVGDDVVLVGRDGDTQITMEEISAEAGSFNYEFPCCISRRVPRYYRKNGQIVHQVHYLLDK